MLAVVSEISHSLEKGRFCYVYLRVKSETTTQIYTVLQCLCFDEYDDRSVIVFGAKPWVGVVTDQ